MVQHAVREKTRFATHSPARHLCRLKLFQPGNRGPAAVRLAGVQEVLLIQSVNVRWVGAGPVGIRKRKGPGGGEGAP